MLPSSVHREQQQPDSEACTQHPDLNFNSIKRKQGSCSKRPVRDWEQGLGSESMTQPKCRRARASVEAPRRRKLYLLPRASPSLLPDSAGRGAAAASLMLPRA